MNLNSGNGSSMMGLVFGKKQEELLSVSLKNYIRKKNAYGINFPIGDPQFGKTVPFLDVTFYIDKKNKIQHKGYTKPTDGKRYRRPHSFHRKIVFEATPYSQMF